MTNILEAIYNIVQYRNFELKKGYIGRNRANSMGEALEYYVKDAFAGTFGIKNNEERDAILEDKFSWLGNQNNPPDSMIKGGDAIEVKKIRSANSSLALNSSYPKATIRSDSTLITPSFRECEDWTERDIIYCIGHTDDNLVKSLWMVYGNIYAARHETYQRIKNTITEGINSIENVDFAETNELGGVKRVDPLGITNLRIRGMWSIQNPRKVFDYAYSKKDKKKSFELVCVLPNEKYNSFEKSSRSKIESINSDDFSISDVRVKDPNNPAKRINCKLIVYNIS